MYKLRQTTDPDELEEIKGLDALAFEGVGWPGDDHTWWIAKDEQNKTVGYCGAVYRPALGYVYMSRAAVMACAQGYGLQRRMIHARVRWARTTGAKEVITYTLLKNYSSLRNLLHCGFRFYDPEKKYVGEHVHYYRLELK